MNIMETAKGATLKLGMLMAKVNTNTTCLWIYFQPQEPEAMIKMRKKNR